MLGGNDNGRKLTAVCCLNEKTGTWSGTSSMPVGLAVQTVVNYRESIFVFGGWHQAGGNSSESFVFDTVRKSWSKKADMPQACSGGSSVVYRDKIYVLGGSAGCCMSYDAYQDKWQTHSTPRKNSTGGFAVVWGDRILLCGGKTTVIEEYNPDTDTWTDWTYSLPQQACGKCNGVFAF